MGHGRRDYTRRYRCASLRGMSNKIVLYVRLEPDQAAELEAWSSHIGESKAVIVRSALREFFVAHQTKRQRELAAK
jgi:predicted transcriptional regulator